MSDSKSSNILSDGSLTDILRLAQPLANATSDYCYFINVIDLANSMLETFAGEYRTVYGCQVFTSHEESDEYMFPFALKFSPVSWI